MDETLSLGRWIRRRRKALDLTQDELARRIGVAAVTLRKIETDARRPSQQVAARLAEHLQLAPQERDVFVRAARRSLTPGHLPVPVDSVARVAFPHSHTPDAGWPVHNLPASLTTLIGRDHDLASLNELLQGGARLTTVAGPGGVGKTRLVLELASRLAADGSPRCIDGLWLADLAALSDASLVAPAIARAVGATEGSGQTLVDSLKTFLSTRRALLMLDNLEHLPEAALLVSDLLHAAPALCVLATSRAPLGLAGEHVWALGPLAVEAAVALFEVRARQARSDFVLAAADHAVVAQIARRLDGLPLAIELAAARARLFEPAELLAQLTAHGSLPVLEGGIRDLPARQQTLRATLEWSYALLSEVEQGLLARLSVFAGGFTLAAAEAVCGFEHATVQLLAGLVDHSLVQRIAGTSGTTRFALLATVQEFARELLAASGSTGEVRRRHALYMLELAEAAEPHLIGPQQGEWRRLLMVEHDNMAAALKWSLAESSDPIIGLRISMALLWYWKPLGYRREGLTWLEAALARCSDCAPGVRAHALHGAGTLAGRLLDYALAERRLEEALTLSRTLGDVSGILDTLLQLCAFTREQGSYERARVLADESLTLARLHRRLDVVVASLLELGNIALAQGEYGRALMCYDAALPDARQSGNMQAIGWIVANMGRVALEQGATQQAEELYQESSDLFERAGLLDSLAWMGYELGRVALQRGEVDQAAQRFVSALEQAQRMGLALLIACAIEGLAALRSSRWPLHAARLLGAASQIRSDIANPPTCAEQAQQVRISAQLHRMLDAPGFAAAWQSGRQLSWEQAVEQARVGASDL